MTDPQPDSDAPKHGRVRDDSETLLHNVATATGHARAAVEIADHGVGHTARQLVYALSQGAVNTPLLRELATESERLSGSAVRLHSRSQTSIETAERAVESGDRDAMVAARDALNDVHDDGRALYESAQSVRRRLPREYGDPLNLDRDWPADTAEKAT